MSTRAFVIVTLSLALLLGASSISVVIAARDAAHRGALPVLAGAVR